MKGRIKDERAISVTTKYIQDKPACKTISILNKTMGRRELIFERLRKVSQRRLSEVLLTWWERTAGPSYPADPGQGARWFTYKAKWGNNKLN